MRVRDVTLNEFNEVANAPEVLAAINPQKNRIDLAWIYETPGVWCKGCDGVRGCALIIPWPNNTREIHWFLPGANSTKAIRAIVDWVFERTDTTILFGNTPKSNLHARIVNRWLGGRVVGELVDDLGRPAVTFSLSRDEWARHKTRLT